MHVIRSVLVSVPPQWVNGVEVVSHSGGHLPFEANITSLVTTGATNRITAAVNNTLTPHTLPPGTLTHGGPPTLPQNYVVQNLPFDFFNYAGMVRMHLIATVALIMYAVGAFQASCLTFFVFK